MAYSKKLLRKSIWDTLVENDVSRFPLPPHGRIPNFEGAMIAAKKLSQDKIWGSAKVIKINPDSPQQPVRQLALTEGKILYMAVPRLREEKCFIELNPARLKAGMREATSIRGAIKRGKAVSPDEMREVDLVVAGSVAVNYEGGRVGKGGGYSDLEYALAKEAGLLDEDTPIVTTVHKLQVVEESIPIKEHDISLDLIATTDGVRKTNRKTARPPGIIWELLRDDQIESIPILKKLKKA